MVNPKNILITGGAGFIGSALIRYLIKEVGCSVVNIDKLTYAANLSSLDQVKDNSRYFFEQSDICDRETILNLLRTYRPNAVMHLAAESHVDRSIDGPDDFIKTNILGTYELLEAVRIYWSGLETEERKLFRFHHISTDEVFGSLGETGYFTETTPYDPRSPYSASKASSDHLARAWFQTFGIPIVVSNCSNNYGPYHFPEKLIPLMIIKGLKGDHLPIYGLGDNIRDWLYVEDHVRALYAIVTRGRPGESYNVGGGNEISNVEVVTKICELLDELVPCPDKGRHDRQITFVQDRLGHDFRYSIDDTKIRNELKWKPKETFESGLRKTVIWYLNNEEWWQPILKQKYEGHRLGLGSK